MPCHNTADVTAMEGRATESELALRIGARSGRDSRNPVVIYILRNTIAGSIIPRARAEARRPVV